jgi:outer membrane protein assembly factor BamA
VTGRARQHWHARSNDSRINIVIPRALLALCLLIPAPAFAQTRTKSTAPSRTEGHKLASVNIVGSDRYTPAEVMAAVGLRIGNVASEDDFNRATRDLASTGLFTDVAYTYAFDAAGTHLEMKLQDNTRLVPTHFQNIVWFSDEKLQSELRERVPLFHGLVPLSGNLPDQVSDAIQAMLLENKFPGHVDYTRVGPEGGPIDAVNFAVDNVTLRVEHLAIVGAQPADVAALQSKLSKLENREYTQAAVSAFADKELLPYYLAHGYLKASFGPPQPKVAQQVEDDTMLDVTVPLAQGRVYQLAGIEWSGNKQVPTDQLQKLFQLPLNQPANAVQLDSAMREVEQLYGSHGYVKATVKPVPQFDDSKGTVTYDLQVQEGELYKMGELEIRGVDSKTSSQMLEKWAIRQGTPYDSTYAKRFIEEAWKLLPSRVEWTVSAHEAVDDREKVVDVSLLYGVQERHQEP